MKIRDLVESLGPYHVVGRAIKGPASMTVTISKGRGLERIFMLPYPPTDKSIEALKKALADW